ncbi:MAG TPA: ROK family protein [Acetobacteraceae bacterium]|nr:ROK family protein [Acetobacteraceae bacterium]
MSMFRIGVDLGGTKTEIAALNQAGEILIRRRIPTPQAGGQAAYDEAVDAIVGLVRSVEQELGATATVGMGIPGVISPVTGLVKNANSNALNGHPIDRDLSEALAREVRVANDANCFALSEAVDGAGAGQRVVFGVIVGTGCGAGIVVNRQIIEGRNRVAGEWGHIPLPWPSAEESPGPRCWCGQHNCLELWISGTALARDCDGPLARDASSIPARAAAGDAQAQAALERHVDRMARGLAVVINVIDPDVVVLGGGLSNMEHLYHEVPKLLPRYVFSDFVRTPIVPNKHGDSSGVRGAAWLWPAADPA